MRSTALDVIGNEITAQINSDEVISHFIWIIAPAVRCAIAELVIVVISPAFDVSIHTQYTSKVTAYDYFVDLKIISKILF